MYKLLSLLLFLIVDVQAKEIPVLFLQRDIKKSEVITEDDVRVVIIDHKTDKGYIQSLGDRPVKAISNLQSDKPVKKSDILIDRFTVHKGETVIVQFVRKNLVIDTQGLAMSNGAIGDIIKVKNTDTNKMMVCRVTGERLVTIS